MPMRSSYVLGGQICPSLSDGGAGDREWFLAAGTGGYATGTAAGLRTRRMHAFLVTPAHDVALVTLDPVLTLPSGARVELATHEWASGAVAPQGHLLLAAFDLTDGLPRWRWRIGDVVVERGMAMEYGRTSVGIVHRIVATPEPVWLTLGALCTWHTDGGALEATQVADGATVSGAYRIAGPGCRPRRPRCLGACSRRHAAGGRAHGRGTATAAGVRRPRRRYGVGPLVRPRRRTARRPYRRLRPRRHAAAHPRRPRPPVRRGS